MGQHCCCCLQTNEEVTPLVSGSNDKIFELQLENESLKQRVKELSKKLAEEMGKKVARNESSMENVSIKNRPMNVAEDYSNHCSNQWLDVKQELDNLYEKSTNYKENEAYQLLCFILRLCEEKCVELLHNIPSKMAAILKSPHVLEILNKERKDFHHSEHHKALEESLDSAKIGTLVDDIPTELLDYLRTGADNVRLDTVIYDIEEKLNKKYKKDSVWQQSKEMPTMKSYIKSSVLLSWKMVLQRPKMTFLKVPQKFDESTYDKQWGSSEDKQVDIVEVHPALCHGDKLMTKGKVLLKNNVKQGKIDDSGKQNQQ